MWYCKSYCRSRWMWQMVCWESRQNYCIKNKSCISHWSCISLHQSYVTHIGFTFLLRQQNGGVNMKVLFLGCKTWKNNVLVFVSFIEDYAFTKNINFSQPHQVVLVSATVVVIRWNSLTVRRIVILIACKEWPSALLSNLTTNICVECRTCWFCNTSQWCTYHYNRIPTDVNFLVKSIVQAGHYYTVVI